jgi:hypothetical protein
MFNDDLNIDLGGTPRQSVHVSQLSNNDDFSSGIGRKHRIHPIQNNQDHLRDLDSVSNVGGLAHGSFPSNILPSVTTNHGVHFNQQLGHTAHGSVRPGSGGLSHGGQHANFNQQLGHTAHGSVRPGLGGLSHGGQHANLNANHILSQKQESAAHGGINDSNLNQVQNLSVTLISGKIVSVEDEYIIHTSVHITDPATLALMENYGNVLISQSLMSLSWIGKPNLEFYKRLKLMS